MNFQAQAACLYGQQIMSKLKGFKLSVKDFRRNMLLKTRADNSKSNKSTPLIQQASILQNKIKSKNSTSTLINQNITSKNPHTYAFNIRKKYKSSTQYHNQLYSDYQNQLSCQLNNDRRMNQYLSVVLKKAKNDTSKLLKSLQKKKQKSDSKIIFHQSDHNNFIKRFKLQIKKIKLQKQKNYHQIPSDCKQNPQQNASHKTIQRIKKTQQTSLFQKYFKLNKILIQPQNFNKIINSSLSSPNKQSINYQKISKTKRQKSTR